jgi:CubicO group peptidase (beta-lactamase class C family)
MPGKLCGNYFLIVLLKIITMQKLIVAVASLFTQATATVAQDATKYNNDLMKDKVVQFFNKQQTDSLYSLAGAAFQKQLSASAFKNVCHNNLYPLGEIKSMEFEKFFPDKKVSKYKATFDNAILSFFLNLDDTGKLETFLFQPYKKEITGPIKKTTSDNTLATAMDKDVDKLLQPFMQNSKTVGLSIGLLKNGQTFFYNYGEVKNGTGQLPSATSLYEIGSITKTFTGILLAKAVVEKKVKLSDPINKYLPKNAALLRFGSTTATIMHLANHTSGLPPLPDNFTGTDLINPYKDYDNAKLLAYLTKAKLTREPGKQFEYCNLGVGLLGYILEKVYNKPYEQLVMAHITAAIGANNTMQQLKKTDAALFVQGYNESITPSSQWDFKALAAAGALRSNTTDMLKYAAANCDAGYDTKKLATLKNAIALSHQPTFTDGGQQICLNWFIQNWNGNNILFHGGQTGAYKSFLSINPKTKNAVIILANTAVSNDEIGVALQSLIDKQ